MRDLAKILLPVDFSERSVGAARYAKALAARFGSELTLLHVLTPPQLEFGALDIGGSMLSELYRCRSEQARRELDAFLASELAGPNVRRIILEGDPASKIVELAHAFPDQTVIIMPTHGYGPFRRFILGSNTAKVLHDADCPVWTGVHIEEATTLGSIPFRSILCAVDLGPQSSKTLCWATRLAQEFGARLLVVHATGAAPDAPEPGDDSAVRWQAALRKSAGEELLRLQKFVGMEAEFSVEAGEPTKVICVNAERLRADLLVIGRGSAAGVFGRLRTNAYAIIRESPCPVVSV
ncbi:MAG: universal stress protein, partial [Acidobacteriia bacterium]|nr:universal stress protein [Terriglobia bacterium]